MTTKYLIYPSFLVLSTIYIPSTKSLADTATTKREQEMSGREAGKIEEYAPLMLWYWRKRAKLQPSEHSMKHKQGQLRWTRVIWGWKHASPFQTTGGCALLDFSWGCCRP